MKKISAFLTFFIFLTTNTMEELDKTDNNLHECEQKCEKSYPIPFGIDNEGDRARLEGTLKAREMCINTCYQIYQAHIEIIKAQQSANKKLALHK